jgi:hypothetical protein
MLRGVYPERTAEMLRFAQHDKQRAQHDSVRLARVTYLRNAALGSHVWCFSPPRRVGFSVETFRWNVSCLRRPAGASLRRRPARCSLECKDRETTFVLMKVGKLQYYGKLVARSGFSLEGSGGALYRLVQGGALYRLVQGGALHRLVQGGAAAFREGRLLRRQ